jgi:hypothetical protein
VAVEGLPVALRGPGDWGFVLVRLGWLAIFLAVGVLLARRAFAAYGRSI